MYTAKSSGTANSTLDKFVKIFPLVMDTKTDSQDKDRLRKFPRSARSMSTYLGLKTTSKQETIYICPTRTPSKKRGEKHSTYEICGYTLSMRNHGHDRTYSCDLCETESDKAKIEKDGNQISVTPVKDILSWTMNKYGKYCTSHVPRPTDNKLRGVQDGSR